MLDEHSKPEMPVDVVISPVDILQKSGECFNGAI